MSFSESSLLKKFQELNNTQQSVQTLSLWLIHHRKHSNTIVSTWLNELLKSTKCERKITFIYLANDILQNSRKKGYEYMQEFAKALPDAIENTSKYSDTKMKFTLERILNIWKDRKIYPDESIENLKTILHGTKSLVESPGKNGSDVDGKQSPKKQLETKSKIVITKTTNNGAQKLQGKSSIDQMKSEDIETSNKKRKLASDDNKKMDIDNAHQANSSVETSNKPANLHKTSLREEIMKELAQNNASIQIPEPLELVNMLQDLEKSASSDAVVREKIAQLPSKVSDLNALKSLKDKKEALDLSTKVNDAASLLDNYNTRLQQELANRKKTALLLASFIKQQKQEYENDLKIIDEWQLKFKQVKQVKSELQIHLESLPDLTSIEEAAIMKPLPSAGDLFSS